MDKKFLAGILALACCLGTSAVALAKAPDVPNPPQIVSPRYATTNTVYSELSLSGSTATLTSRVDCKSGTTKVVITQVLQKKSGSGYSDVSGKSWTKTETKKAFSFKNTSSVSKGQTYRVKTTAKITGSGGTDTVTKYSAAVTCK